MNLSLIPNQIRPHYLPTQKLILNQIRWQIHFPIQMLNHCHLLLLNLLRSHYLLQILFHLIRHLHSLTLSQNHSRCHLTQKAS